MQKRRHIQKKILTTFHQFGYNEIQTPIFETLELFTAKSGQAIIDELYTFQDKGQRNLALRPELTAPVMRMYVEKLQMEPKPLKLFYFGQCFRYDRPQKGRYREFFQAGCELIGTNTPEAHAELIALAYTLLKNVGLKNITLKIGNLDLVQALFKHHHISDQQKQELLPLIDKEEFDELKTYLHNTTLTEQDIDEILHLLQTTDLSTITASFKKQKELTEELQKTQHIFTLLTDAFSIPTPEFHLSIVRGLDYYQGLVFEIEAPILGAEKQLCGGGTYSLIDLFGGTPTPTAGFAIGFDRTILALEEEHYHFPESTIDLYLIPVTPKTLPNTLHLAQQIRKQGYIVDIDLLQRGIGKALKHANTKNTTYAIIIGPDELKQNVITLRNMDTGKQQSIPTKELITTLNKIIPPTKETPLH